MATTRIRHLIELAPDGQPGLFFPIEFASRDIGATQGTTLTLGGRTIARYRPGTRHWHSALEVAEQLVTTAAGRAEARGFFDPFVFCTELKAAVAEHPHCTPWDGTVPDGWDAE